MRETIVVTFLHPAATMDHVGFIPSFLSTTDPRPAVEQFDTNYAHGGGWHAMSKFKLNTEDMSLKYPGDPKLLPLAAIHFRDELILIYEAAMVCVIQKDGSFEVSRMD